VESFKERGYPAYVTSPDIHSSCHPEPPFTTALCSQLPSPQKCTGYACIHAICSIILIVTVKRENCISHLFSHIINTYQCRVQRTAGSIPFNRTRRPTPSLSSLIKVTSLPPYLSAVQLTDAHRTLTGSRGKYVSNRETRWARNTTCQSCTARKVKCRGGTAQDPTCDHCTTRSLHCVPSGACRTIVACRPCKKSKIKCREGESGASCGTCTDSGRECSYVAGATILGEAGKHGTEDPEKVLDDRLWTNTGNVPTHQVSQLTVAKSYH
jgi:hypothetical protein